MLYHNLISLAHIAYLIILYCSSSTYALSLPFSSSNAYVEISPDHTSRLDKIKSMFAWEGFVYALDDCPSFTELVTDFTKMKLKGARNVITFDYCGTGTEASYYEEVISAAGATGLNIIPLAWTLLVSSNQTFENTSLPKVEAVTKAVIKNPDPVLAVALGDEPLYDNDAGSASNLARYIVQMKSNFTAAGLDIPVSISDLAYGWQISGNITPVADAVDFFMINNFPYFDFDAESGGSNTSWADFMNDIEYFESIAGGRPLLVTQTGWPSNEDLWLPNSPAVVASIASEQSYWELLDSHCEDFFKAKNIGWMWRDWSDVLTGWGVLDSNGKPKWDFSARLIC